MHKQFFKCFKL